MERDCEDRIHKEKQRYREKEHENRHNIKSLIRQVEQEKDRRLQDLTNFADLKRKVSIYNFMVITCRILRCESR